MKVTVINGETTITFSSQEKVSALLTLKAITETRATKSSVGDLEMVCKTLYTLILRDRIAQERSHLCLRCFSTIDIKVDKHHVTSFPDGRVLYQHLVCPVKTMEEQNNGKPTG